MLSSLNVAKHWAKLGEAAAETKKTVRKARYALLPSPDMIWALDVVLERRKGTLHPRFYAYASWCGGVDRKKSLPVGIWREPF